MHRFPEYRLYSCVSLSHRLYIKFPSIAALILLIAFFMVGIFALFAVARTL
jgi:hypothetical protein